MQWNATRRARSVPRSWVTITHESEGTTHGINDRGIFECEAAQHRGPA